MDQVTDWNFSNDHLKIMVELIFIANLP